MTGEQADKFKQAVGLALAQALQDNLGNRITAALANGILSDFAAKFAGEAAGLIAEPSAEDVP